MSNERPGRAKRNLAAMILAALAVTGVGGAALAQASSTPVPAVSQTQEKAAAEEATEAAEDPAAEAAEEADEGIDDQTQDPMLNGSIQAPAETDGLSEADEAKALEGLATISPAQAEASATAVVPGTVLQVELDNENGSVVYSVEIDNGNGGHIDVKVDAGNGTVLHQDADND